MGHLPIINQTTLRNVVTSGVHSIHSNLKSMWVKTTSDILSDILAVRKGDLIFPWIVKDSSGKNIGFKYVFKVAGDPYYVKGQDYPFCIPLESEGLEFDVPLSEAEALDLWERKLLWNAIGKKSLGRGRSLTHQSPMEDKRLLDLLNEKNPKGPNKITLGNSEESGEKLTINPKQSSIDRDFTNSIEELPEDKRISNLQLNKIQWRSGRFFVTEKTLEAWFMENIDKNTTDQFKRISFPEGKILWFANYLPFGVQGSNMDVVVLQELKEGTKLVHIIELKVSSLNKTGYEEASKQVINYAFFLKDAFKAYEMDVNLNCIVLSGKSNPRDALSQYSEIGLKTSWITYGIDDSGTVLFEKLV